MICLIGVLFFLATYCVLEACILTGRISLRTACTYGCVLQSVTKAHCILFTGGITSPLMILMLTQTTLASIFHKGYFATIYVGGTATFAIVLSLLEGFDYLPANELPSNTAISILYAVGATQMALYLKTMVGMRLRGFAKRYSSIMHCYNENFKLGVTEAVERSAGKIDLLNRM